MFGYPISSSIPILLNIPSTPINTSFRIIYLLVTFFLLYATMHDRKGVSTTIGGWIMFFAIILYGTRILHDVFIEGQIVKSKFYLLSYVFGSCLLPAVAVVFSAKYINLIHFRRYLFSLLLVGNVIILALTITQIDTFSIYRLFSGRATLGGDSDRYVINPITIAYYGEVLALVSLYFLFIAKSKAKYIYLLSLIIGITNLLSGGSRGPMIFGVIVSILIVFFHFKKSRYNTSYFLKGTAVLFVTLLAYLCVLRDFISSSKFTVVTRIKKLIDTGTTSSQDNRPELISSAWNQFVENPIFGDSYLCSLNNAYPHNIIVEILMALGVLGAIIFFLLFALSFWRIIKLIFVFNHEAFVASLILFAVFLASMTSGSLYLNPAIWIWSAFFLVAGFGHFNVSPSISNIRYNYRN